MRNNQPKWHCIHEPTEAEPYRVFLDMRGLCSPEVEYLRKEDNRLFRFSIERCIHADGHVSDNYYHPEMSAWFDNGLNTVARSIGNHNLEFMLCSPDVLQRAAAYVAIGQYHGFENLDSYPTELTEEQEKEDWLG